MTDLKDAIKQADLTVEFVSEENLIQEECYADCWLACTGGGLFGDQRIRN